MNRHRNKKKLVLRSLVLLLMVSLLIPVFLSGGSGTAQAAESIVSLFKDAIDTNRDSFFNSSVVYRLPDTVKESDELSLIIEVNEDSILDVFDKTKPGMTLSQYAFSEEAAGIRDRIGAEKAELLSALNKAGISYKTGADYATLISGFEIVITARDFESVCKTFHKKANTYIAEVYNKAETQLVENDVDVYESGIFDSSDVPYDGTGTVVAVLDTGLDYNHSAFSVSNFTADRSKLGLTFDEVAALISSTRASELRDGLTASDVYINEKVPFGFDYADSDPDVYPVDSDHGTHVAGIIAGKDDVITGVAPNAQLVIMKTFSDVKDNAIATWILSALEDCVVLGVDVINMSLGTSCGFSRESDEEMLSGVYDRIRERGISLVVAASNAFNSTYGSEKNGNLGLTSNPDSATVGSPSTYKGAISIASVSGVKTPYILYGDKIIYFNESTDRISEEKHFVEELLKDGATTLDIEFVKIPGAGRSADYTGIDVTGKIALISRGSTTFEEKANVAQQKGAAGVIIYNNVSGDIKMNVGETTIPVCSISQDDGEMLAALGSATIRVATTQTSGPFMSDFSSWGPSPSLEIKPELTAHGGSIYSAVPGQSYDRISGTSMATPNISGVTALLRQYVFERFPELKSDPVKATALVNQLMMSTADILLAKNGLPYSVRRQGAGLANLDQSIATNAYISAFDRLTGEISDKSKIELGDDPDKNGVYTLKFMINNFGSSAITYNLSAYVFTEGVSDTKTLHGDTTVTEEAYLLAGATVTVNAVTNGTQDGSSVTVGAGQTATVTMTVTLSAEDKAYLDASFKNGMYVEGFVTLDAVSESEVDLNVPYLAFYGDWTQAPIFDLDYFATNKDELDNSIDMEDKTLPDAYATRPIGGLSGDYVSYLGSFYFEQNPADVQISADRKYISLSNQTDAVNSLRFVWAGLLRNAARVDVVITDDSTGEIVFETTDTDVRKSYGDGGSIYPANVEIEFSAIEENLKNNTSYTVTLKAYTPYGDGGAENNVSNTFTFPLVTDFEAPAITDCEFYTEYDSANKELRYYAKMSVYDNHYAMAVQPGYVGLDAEGTGYMLYSFGQYLTPVYSSFNSTSYVVYELTDYIDEIRKNATNRNTFTVACYDYALNTATYEIELPDEFLDLCFTDKEITISPNEIYDLAPLVYPETEWSSLLEYISTKTEVAAVVNNKLVGVKAGKAVIVARDPVSKKQATISVTVLAEGDEGYKKYDKPVLDTFRLVGYKVDKAYYFLSSDERDIGLTGDERKFTSDSPSLSMYPSEAVTLKYILDAYFPKDTTVSFESSNENIVKVDENGKITAVAEGFASISVRVVMDGKNTYYSKSISISVKDPYVTTGSILSHYFGNGGKVEIPASLALTEIGQYAFSNFDYVDKEPHEITKHEPEYTKPQFLGDNTIEEVIIPEGVKTINAYAFAGLTALKRVVLPSTIERIDQGAFYGCTALVTIEGLDKVKFINQGAFFGCSLDGKVNLANAVAIADYAFAGNASLDEIILSKVSQSVGAYAFYGCKSLAKITVEADFVKLGQYVFSGCEALKEISLNTAVVTRGAFQGCKKLERITLGKDVAVIAEYAFGGTALREITVDSANTALKTGTFTSYLTNKEGTALILVLPASKGTFSLSDPKITTVSIGAFSGCEDLTMISLPHVTAVEDYAFAGCELLAAFESAPLKQIGDYAFYGTALTAHPDFSALKEIGDYAFAYTVLKSVTIPDGVTVGTGAFSDCTSLASVTIGNGVTVGDNAFYIDSNRNWTYSFYTVGTTRYYYYVFLSPLRSLTIGDDAVIGAYAFYGAAELESVTLGKNAVIGDYAFYNATELKSIDLSSAKSIGSNAFSGDVLYVARDSSWSVFAFDENGYYIYSYHAPALQSVDLSKVTTLGTYAFAYCRDLESVKLSVKLSEIPEGAFNACASLKTVNLSQVTAIGDNAFAECSALRSVDLSKATEIGRYAFSQCEALDAVRFNESGCVIGEGAFAYCGALTAPENLDAVTAIDAYAFAYTGITKADLSAAVSIGEHAFLKEFPTAFEVVLGESLESLGDNPFAMCILPAFESVETVVFNEKEYTTPVYTFDISDSVRVIDGLLYRVVPNGLELVSYAGSTASVTPAEGTVRISAMAFAGNSAVKQVILPYTVHAIGHKAFYGCYGLKLVTFTSYDAPILEEEYDMMYFASGDHISATGAYTMYTPDGLSTVTKEGLGIVPYFMWNATDTPTTVYYGANFVNYIGHVTSKLTMVAPSNGQNYNSFIFTQYFDTVIDGAPAADAITLEAIAAINRLPETVSLSDRELVEAARAAYDRISTLEQRSLVTEYAKLTQAEKRISDLLYLENGDTPADTEPVTPDKPKLDLNMASVALLLLAVVAGIMTVMAIVFAILLSKQSKAKKEAENEAKPAETIDPAAEEEPAKEASPKEAPELTSDADFDPSEPEEQPEMTSEEPKDETSEENPETDAPDRESEAEAEEPKKS